MDFIPLPIFYVVGPDNVPMEPPSNPNQKIIWFFTEELFAERAMDNYKFIGAIREIENIGILNMVLETCSKGRFTHVAFDYQSNTHLPHNSITLQDFRKSASDADRGGNS